jgi:hypothetical protein
VTAIAFPAGPLGLVLSPSNQTRVRFAVRGIYQRTLFEEATARAVLHEWHRLMRLEHTRERLLRRIESAFAGRGSSPTALHRAVDRVDELGRVNDAMRTRRAWISVLASQLGLPFQPTRETVRACRAYLAGPASQNQP